MGAAARDASASVDAALLPDAGNEDLTADQVASVLRLIGEHRDQVDRFELAFLDAVLARGWTWEQLGAAMGKRSKQAAQQHAKRLRGRLIEPKHIETDSDAGAVAQVSTATPNEPIAGSSPGPVDKPPAVVPLDDDERSQHRRAPDLEPPAEVVVPVKWRSRGRAAAPYTGPTRFDRTVPATSCPTCDFSPAGQSLRGRLREDLKVTWLECDEAGELVDRAHCERCQPRAPRHRIADLSCVKCGEGPLLVGRFAAAWADEHRIAPAVAEWLTEHGWRDSLQGMVCGDHG